MKEGKHNKTKNDERAIDDAREVDASAAEKSCPKKKIAIRMVTGIAAAAVGIGIGLLVSGKLGLRAMLPASAAKGTKAIADEAAKVVAQAPSRPPWRRSPQNRRPWTSTGSSASCPKASTPRRTRSRTRLPSGSTSPRARPS